jgi:5-methylcytosine-specific restriction protein A
MTTAPLRYCIHPGCRTLVSGQPRCDPHATQRHREHDARRDPANRALYNNTRWRTYSRNRLAQYPLCVRCSGLAEVTDHIKPHRGDYEAFWDPANHQSLCKPCHDRKTAREDGAFGRPAVERGQPSDTNCC